MVGAQNDRDLLSATVLTSSQGAPTSLARPSGLDLLLLKLSFAVVLRTGDVYSSSNCLTCFDVGVRATTHTTQTQTDRRKCCKLRVGRSRFPCGVLGTVETVGPLIYSSLFYWNRTHNCRPSRGSNRTLLYRSGASILVHYVSGDPTRRGLALRARCQGLRACRSSLRAARASQGPRRASHWQPSLPKPRRPTG